MKTVRDLINDLSELNPDLLVGIASDEEGNSVNAYYELSFAFYDDQEYRGDQFAGYLYDDEGDETEVTEETATAIVLWP